jgi:hypothetical protein
MAASTSSESPASGPTARKESHGPEEPLRRLAADRCVPYRPSRQRHRRQSQRGPGSGQAPAVHAGHLPSGRQRSGGSAGHRRAGPGLSDARAGQGNSAMEIADVDGGESGGHPVRGPGGGLARAAQGGRARLHRLSRLRPDLSPRHLLSCRWGVGRHDGLLVTIHSNNVVGDNFWLWRADTAGTWAGRPTGTRPA